MIVPTPQRIREVAAEVVDPELPFLTLADLGVLREVAVDTAGRVSVTITPTYSGCPALVEMRAALRDALADAGCVSVEIRTVLSPAWTTDWISDRGRQALLTNGIAPPRAVGPAAREAARGGPVPLQLTPPPALVRCPQCASTNTEELSRFGATACRALRRCLDCREPFEQVKEI
ncbi:ring-1,2-phenylacetyl-CoA epoxidase subunit PaaD [Actinoalloteichus hymeniacidonis]|uniref:Phenylacetate-CoA oxygenase, PaaJ subunit n=1 Tax=Actinoalloteichus hymeniacidonis TaxID=340345 RepID=A0AAC9HLL0_9PSEU|nr:1,2-phenylacetyl-CoA epoxidase subunit PaaD [Actinoalloteichus hymeniacidonis]AOS61353.1 phenylacetate-CoA oxygenase, PaaJ subunit [Actinoalloteichus hymeniacidonis]MBB5910642.1 ring-1,2-phenylacetyl-CoA epoxidase subunit PaaD [Actinoalloteichus hymeniacidonis]